MIISKLIVDAAKQTGISPNLLAAVIHQESAGQIYAVRYEPNFFDKYVKPKTRQTLQGHVPRLCSLETERRMRATSFGLMQIMGQVARERGFKGEFLTELLDPAANIKWGSEFLQTLLLKYEGTDRALLRWNGGGNPDYAKEVLGHIDSGECHYLLCC
jgi:soluble lytic murein transglycosylase-like protein